MKAGKLSSNMEDYLEAAASLLKKNGVARVRDIGEMLHVKKPSVTAALNTLSRAGLVLHERYGYVQLTPQGKKIADDVQARHDILIKFLTGILSIDPRTAAEEACRLEHALSAPTFQKLTKFIEFVATHPDRSRPDWFKSLDHYFKTGRRLRCKFRNIRLPAAGKKR